MLILDRKLNQALLIDGGIRVTVMGIAGGHVKLGIDAPRPVRVLREELADRPPAGKGRVPDRLPSIARTRN